MRNMCSNITYNCSDLDALPKALLSGLRIQNVNMLCCWLFLVLVWKNFKFFKKHYCKTIFEILVPIFLVGLFCITLSLFKTFSKTYDSHATKSNHTLDGPGSPGQGPSQGDNQPSDFLKKKDGKRLPRIKEKVDGYAIQLPNGIKVSYTPSNEFTDALMESVRELLNMSDKPKIVESEKDMVHGEVGVIFVNADTELKYILRTSSTDWKVAGQMYLNIPLAGPPDGTGVYFKTGFVAVQQAIDRAFINSVVPKEKTQNINYTIQEFPFPPYHASFEDKVVSPAIFPLSIVIGYILLCINTVGQIVEDRQTGATELMKMMGMSRAVVWIGWFFQVMFINFFIVLIFTLDVKFVKALLPGIETESVGCYSDIFVIWMFLTIASAAFAVSWFFVSAILHRPWLAMLLCCLGWFGSYLLAFYLDANRTMHLGWKLFSCLIPSLAMYWGFCIMSMHEATEIGMGWWNFDYTPFRDPDDINTLHVFLMLLFDILFYSILTWYLEAICPGKFGIPKPFYFLLTISYWWRGKEKPMQVTEMDDETLEEQNYERVPPDLIPGIRILNLRKTFKRKPAVDGVTIDIYQDQITVLLGHNGAGKTTTMSIMTGMIPATSGSVWINGHNIRTHLSRARSKLGLCPQHDMLFNDLTVKEHLVLFGMLKGLNCSQAIFSALDILKKLGLSTKADAKGKTLSGGMKRKVALGIALVGGSKVVILDEPTTGLDPVARREVWDMLLALRKECTILITTHFMEEADVLGDRIAIMDHGKVQCYGTPLYLKNRYGIGYMLKILTLPGHDLDSISKYVQSSIAGATFKRQIGSELDYVLPQDKKSQFPGLFSGLDSSKQTLHIDSIGLSITTMEDVFIQVGEIAMAGRVIDPATYAAEDLIGSTRPRNKGACLVVEQTIALLVKRIIYTFRRYIALLVYILLPLLMMLGVLFASFPYFDDKKVLYKGGAIDLALTTYEPTTVYHTGIESDIVESYRTFVKKDGSRPIAVDPEVGVSNKTLLLGVADLQTFDKLVAAVEYNESNESISVNAMYSSAAVHSIPIAINLLNNAILKAYAGDDYSITVASRPIAEAESSGSPFFLPTYESVAYVWAALLPLGLIFLIGGFVLFPYEERVSGAKHLQRMTGVGPFHYWLTCFIWDFIVYMFVAVILMLMFVFVDTEHYYGQGFGKEAGAFAVLLVAYGASAIIFAYAFSFWRKSPASSLGFFLGLNITLSFVALLTMFCWDKIELMVRFAQQKDLSEPSSDVVKILISLTPHLNLVFALLDLIQVILYKQCERKNEDCSMWDGEGEGYHRIMTRPPCCSTAKLQWEAVPLIGMVYGSLGWHMVLFAIFTVFVILVMMLVEYRVCSLLWLLMNKSPWRQNPADMERDVRAEFERVFEGGEYELAVYDLKKNYGSNLAVKGVTFGVKAGGCFGLLGFNGAGKTSVFKMLTGLELPTQGDAVIHKYSLCKNRSKFTSQIGYCPQFDAINEYLTGKEMLFLYACLRGVHRRDVKTSVAKWLKLMGLEEYKNVQCGKYSGGNKRKLSTAMALIGDPPLIFLDEPTSGVDPVARRNLWTVLTRVSKLGDRAIVITTHSMEECEALASRLAIMVLGEFVCIGENQYLKNKFCQGFGISIKMTDPPIEEDQAETVKSEFLKMFNPDKCVLKDERRGVLHYHLTDTKVSWNTLFSNMESLKASQKSVEVYTVTETTLEQVFLSFGRK